jgi:NOL1/NOP2/fmu family ribosome biogenesis protein
MNPEWGIVAQEGCYRFDPERLKGEGFFFALLQKVGEKISTFSNPLGVKSVAPVNKHLTPTEWLPDGFNLFTKGDLVKALPIVCASEVVELESLLRVVQSGVAVARKKGNDWVPEADLALSLALRADAFPVAEVDLTMARRYLSRETISINDAQSGYLLIQYQNSRLGFVKNIGTRINNLYPPSRRIRMGV